MVWSFCPSRRIGAASRSRLRDWAGQGDGAAATALALSEDPRKLLWTVQGWTTLLVTLAGVAGGVFLVPRISDALPQAGAVAPYRHGVAFGVVVLAITAGFLCIGQMVPRRIAHIRSERLARWVSRPVQLLSLVAVPLVGALSAADRPVLACRGGSSAVRAARYRGRDLGLASRGYQGGRPGRGRARDDQARAAVQRPPRPGTHDAPQRDRLDRPGRPPRGGAPQGHGQPAHAIPRLRPEPRQLAWESFRSRTCLCRDQNIEPFRIKGRLTLPLFIYEGTRGLKILEMFKKSTSRVAIVLDEYGTVEGLLSLTDILRSDRGRHAGRRRGRRAGRRPARRRVVASGRPAAARRVSRPVRAASRPGRRLPHPGRTGGHTARPHSANRESFDGWGLHFEVVDMDGNRVDRILVKRVANE